MSDTIFVRYSALENMAQNLIASVEAHENTLQRLRQSAQSLYGSYFQGSSADSFLAHYEQSSGELQVKLAHTRDVARNLYRAIEKYREFEADAIRRFGRTPAQRIADSLGISLGAVPVALESSLASGQVLGVSTDHNILNGIDINPDHYVTSPYKEIAQNIQNMRAKYSEKAGFSEHMRNARQRDLELISEVEAQLNSPLGGFFDWITGGTYATVLAGTQERVASWDSMISTVEGQLIDQDAVINEQVQRLALPGDPNAWMGYREGVSNRSQGTGCVAYVLNSTNLPWVDGYNAPGNAIDFLWKAEAWSAAHPEHGIVINQTPAEGAIAVFPQWGWSEKDSRYYGHVAVVVDADNENYVTHGGDTWARSLYANPGHWLSREGAVDATNVDQLTVAKEGKNEVHFIHLPWEEIGRTRPLPQ